MHRRRRSPRIRSLVSAVLVASTASIAACTSTGVKPGTGDLSFRLVWSGIADLDLYVVSPAGERIDFLRREVPSGGRLDIDCNVRRADLEEGATHTASLCDRPMENIFWPRGRAPRGRYRYWAVVANADGTAEGDTYRLEVRRGQRVVRRLEGRVEDLVTAEIGGIVEWGGSPAR